MQSISVSSMHKQIIITSIMLIKEWVHKEQVCIKLKQKMCKWRHKKGSYLCWFPKFDSCRSSAVQLVTAQQGTPSRWSCTADSLQGTSCRVAVHTPQPPTHSLHAWTQGDIDSRLKSWARPVHATSTQFNSWHTCVHKTNLVSFGIQHGTSKIKFSPV